MAPEECVILSRSRRIWSLNTHCSLQHYGRFPFCGSPLIARSSEHNHLVDDLKAETTFGMQATVLRPFSRGGRTKPPAAGRQKGVQRGTPLWQGVWGMCPQKTFAGGRVGQDKLAI